MDKIIKSSDIFKSLKIIKMFDGDIEMLIERVDKFKELVKIKDLNLDLIVNNLIKSIELIRDYEKNNWKYI